MKGILYNIQRFSLHDGPGIRTTVFFKGCNMYCAWCHNPESISFNPQVMKNSSKCTSCGECAKVCKVNKPGCILCKTCVAACPTGAITTVGREYTVAEVMDIVLKDRAYYSKSGGGVTFSGGEASAQPEFLIALAKACKAEGLHTCLDTNGLIPPQYIADIADNICIFLVDFKLERYYEKTTDCINALCGLSKPAILRCPIIPGINDTPSHFKAIRRIRTTYGNVESVEIMPYHSIGASKWQDLGLEYELADVAAPTKEQVAEWEKSVIE